MRYKVSDETFIKTVKESKSISDALKKMGLVIYGSSYQVFKKRVKLLGIDISHFNGKGWAKGTKNPSKKEPKDLKDILVKDSDCRLQTRIKTRIVKTGLLKLECVHCHITNTYNDKPIVLHLDHINGVNTDNRIENLRMLCPNCHSQTDTYCRGQSVLKTKEERVAKELLANKEKIATEDKIKKDAEVKSISETLGLCKNGRRITQKVLDSKKKQERIIWPTEEILKKLVWERPTSQLAKELGVSDKSIEKRCKRLGISKPPPGYWAKQQALTSLKEC